MSFVKAGLVAAVVLTIACASPAYAADVDPAVQALATKIELDLAALSTANGGMPTDEQIQALIATDLSLSTIPLSQKEEALQLVSTDAGVTGTTLPAGTASAAGIAYAALTATGAFVAASGGGAGGGSGFGQSGSGGALGGGSGGPPYTAKPA